MTVAAASHVIERLQENRGQGINDKPLTVEAMRLGDNDKLTAALAHNVHPTEVVDRKANMILEGAFERVRHHTTTATSGDSASTTIATVRGGAGINVIEAHGHAVVDHALSEAGVEGQNLGHARAKMHAEVRNKATAAHGKLETERKAAEEKHEAETTGLKDGKATPLSKAHPHAHAHGHADGDKHEIAHSDKHKHGITHGDKHGDKHAIADGDKIEVAHSDKRGAAHADKHVAAHGHKHGTAHGDKHGTAHAHGHAHGEPATETEVAGLNQGQAGAQRGKILVAKGTAATTTGTAQGQGETITVAAGHATDHHTDTPTAGESRTSGLTASTKTGHAARPEHSATAETLEDKRLRVAARYETLVAQLGKKEESALN